MAAPAQALRVAVRNRSRVGGARVALAYGVLSVVGKWAQMAGQLTYLWDRARGKHARLIEYKSAGPAAAAAAGTPQGEADLARS